MAWTPWRDIRRFFAGDDRYRTVLIGGLAGGIGGTAGALADTGGFLDQLLLTGVVAVAVAVVLVLLVGRRVGRDAE